MLLLAVVSTDYHEHFVGKKHFSAKYYSAIKHFTLAIDRNVRIKIRFSEKMVCGTIKQRILLTSIHFVPCFFFPPPSNVRKLNLNNCEQNRKQK